MTTKHNQVFQRLAQASSVTVVPSEPFPHKCVPTFFVGAASAAGGIDDNQAQSCNPKISSDIIYNRGSCGTISA